MFEVTNHGSLVLFHPTTDDAEAWLFTHTGDDAQWFGRALVVEPRYVPALVHALVGEGFVIQ